MMIRYQSAACSHTGNVRELNEDAFCSHPDAGIWCVADGMGGYEAGEVAAAMVVNAVSHTVAFAGDTNSLQEKVARVQDAVLSVNTELTGHSGEAAASMMGCTVVAVMAEGRECACLWAGDSRLYLLRDGGLYQLSKDHSVVQELLDSGIIDAEQSANHPDRNVITRAVGVDSNLELDYLTFDLADGDVLLLCSDGLHSELSAEAILAVLSAAQGSDQQANQLVATVLDGPARDNVTVGIIEVMSEITAVL
jgi:serine/threonine protein phosphatase PrpC